MDSMLVLLGVDSGMLMLLFPPWPCIHCTWNSHTLSPHSGAAPPPFDHTSRVATASPSMPVGTETFADHRVEAEPGNPAPERNLMRRRPLGMDGCMSGLGVQSIVTFNSACRTNFSCHDGRKPFMIGTLMVSLTGLLHKIGTGMAAIAGRPVSTLPSWMGSTSKCTRHDEFKPYHDAHDGFVNSYSMESLMCCMSLTSLSAWSNADLI
mmetsp:Transcript_32883/g.94399  ORF Transcript_32883/g.94399 Transcript_32883/m.94399 type:complete len:208 (-) Transcript_32883:1289-1912(-)